KDQRTRLDPEVRRHQIVEAAARAFRGRDPAEVTLEEIAETAGVSRALVYNYFGDRGGLLAAVYEHTFAVLNAELDATIGDSLAPEERLRAIVRAYLRFAFDHTEAWLLLQRATGTSHPAVLAARRKHMESLADQWGHSPVGRIVAFAVVGLLESSTFDWLRQRDVDIEEAADVLFDLLWTGLSSLARRGIALPQGSAKASVPI
ncbi:MAG: TetR/AcrR family transcriptional regulator, partial [Acidimicrobiales bacterium]